MNTDDHTFDNHEDQPSKSQAKRDLIALRETSEIILNLKPKDIKRLNLEAPLLEALEEFKRLSKKDAQRRHIIFFTKLLNGSKNIAEIKGTLEEIAHPHLRNQRADKKIQNALDDLLSEDKKKINAFYQNHQNLERQQLQQLIRNALKERKENKEDENEDEKPLGKHQKKLKSFLKEILV